MGRGKRQEPLPYISFKMASNFQGRLELGHIIMDVCNMAQQISLFQRPFQKVHWSGQLGGGILIAQVYISETLTWYVHN